VDVDVRKGSIGCDVWVVGVLGSPRDDVSQKFPKFVFGSFFQSFGDSPSGEFLGGLGLGDGWYPFLFIKTGLGCAFVLLHTLLHQEVTQCCSTSLIRVKNMM
jgi:hypothetical protein